MPLLEVRRHAERALLTRDSALTEAGRRMAASLGGGSYALVLSSPLHRAQETARLIGGRLDATDPALLPDIGGSGIFGAAATLGSWAALLRERTDARAFADAQVAAWSAIAKRVREHERVLAISHSGIIDLPALHLAARLGTTIDGPAFGYCEGVRVTFAKGAPVALEVLRTGR